ncbi:MAG: tRNA (N(6)-L-threonylcarbamoyladenosine(37)-C(2))-methylthiotransferase MtaB [Eubacteriales bacterium]
MKIAFHTLGCKVNQYETQILKEKFSNKGYELSDEGEIADIYVINTCTVTALSNKKSKQFIRKALRENENAVIAVIGCFAQVNPEELMSIDGVSIVCGTNEKNNLVEYVETFLKDRMRISKIKNYDELTNYEETGIIHEMDSRTRAFIKIQEGCNCFCSYCIIPFARGPVRSRNIKEILIEAKTLVASGFKEIVLTGINTALYGFETGELKLAELISEINCIQGDFRIRIGSLEPNVMGLPQMASLLKYEKLCHHMHLSLQSGSDRILEKMNRNYDSNQFRLLVKSLRDFDSNYSITTDVIVGFPGESEEDFLKSLKMVKEIEFGKVHVFKYSKREKTVANNMEDQISNTIKTQRSNALIQIANTSRDEFLKKNIGSETIVLIEEVDMFKNQIIGYSDNYIRVYVDCNNIIKADLMNHFIKVSLTGLYLEGMMGIRIN